MRNKMKWRIAILILLIVTAALFIIMNELAEDSKLEDQLKEAEELVNQIKQKQMLKDHVPAAETLEQTETVTGTVAETESDPTYEQDMESYLKGLSKEQLQQIYASFYTRLGLKPPPPGYEYKWEDIDVPLLDENGDPVLHKIGDPYVDIAIEIGFAPTKEEFEELNQLKEDLGLAEFRGEVDRAASLTQKIETLEALVQRERPVLKTTMWIGEPGTYDRERTRKIAHQQLNELLRSYDLEHLIYIE